MRIRGKQRGTGRSALAFLGVVILLLGMTSRIPAASDSARTKTILVFGDSLSDGFMLSRTQAYPALLVSKLRAAGLPFEVINASLVASVSVGLHPKVKEQLASRMKRIKERFGEAS